MDYLSLLFTRGTDIQQIRDELIEREVPNDVIIWLDDAISLTDEFDYDITSPFDYSEYSANYGDDFVDIQSTYGLIWKCIYISEFLLKYKSYTNEMLNTEISALNKFITFAESLGTISESVSTNNYLSQAANEYLKLTSGYYYHHRIEDLSFNSITSIVEGKYIFYRNFLMDKLVELKGNLTIVQHALKCYYLHTTKSEAPFGAFYFNGGGNSSNDDIVEYCNAHALDRNMFVKQINKISKGPKGKVERTLGNAENIENLNRVYSWLIQSPNANYYQPAIELLYTELCIAKENQKVRKSITINNSIVNPLFNSFKAFFPSSQHDMLKQLLSNDNINEKLLFSGQLNQLAELFKRLYYNGYIKGKKVEVAKWLRKNFYTNVEADLNKDSLYEVITKERFDITDSDKRICNIPELPYLRHVQIKDNKIKQAFT